jgi:hypothetical protein
VGAVTSLIDAGKGYKEWRDTARSKEQQKLGLGAMLSGVASSAQQSATTAYHIANLSGSGAAATAQIVAGGAGVATGAADILRGFYGRSKAAQNIERLKSLPARKLEGRRNEDLKNAVELAKSTQEMRKSFATKTIAKGAVTVAGGVMLAAAATPIGWTLLGIAGLIGLGAAGWRFWNKRKRKKAIAIRELGVKTERDKWKQDVKNKEDTTGWWTNKRKEELKKLGPDPLEKKLKEYKFESIGHFYSNYISYMANYLHNTAVAGRKIIENQVNHGINKKGGREKLKDSDLIDKLGSLSFKEIKSYAEYNGIEKLDTKGNRYPEIEEVLESIGLKFNWRQEPYEPSVSKIGKALDE